MKTFITTILLSLAVAAPAFAGSVYETVSAQRSMDVNAMPAHEMTLSPLYQQITGAGMHNAGREQAVISAMIKVGATPLYQAVTGRMN